MRDYEFVCQNPFGSKKNWQGSVKLWSCNNQKNTSRSCKNNFIHPYQDVIHQHWHSSLCLYSHYRVKCMYHCAVYVQTVWFVSAWSVFQIALLIPSVNEQPQCPTTKLQSYLYCTVRLNNPAHHHKCCDVSTRPLFTSHSAANIHALWLAMASAATCDNKIFHNKLLINNSRTSHDLA